LCWWGGTISENRQALAVWLHKLLISGWRNFKTAERWRFLVFLREFGAGRLP
jgi:hypothetical protein